ncbi:unnamed protein product [Paramecium pentaurelia]|uniref:Uncharacterized protein n=1 Tax=Paramecium pentaurelia TaxID=43138 RepID=A0A8S1YNW5_9CILI|nr:unnamed protein product [Paramecium pentaurelia]
MSQKQLYNYKLIPEFSYKQHRHNTALAINYSNTMLFVADEITILVFQFKNELKKLQQVKSHSSKITTLNVFKQQSGLISASHDGSIILWSQIINPNFKYLARLKGHTDQITCLVLHPFSNKLIISGSNDKSIKFWTFNYSQFQNQSSSSWSCSQTISRHNASVSEISINQDGNKLLSCAEKQIMIMNYSDSNQWQVKQLIQISDVGVRLSFINDYLFAYQPWSGKSIHIYILDSIEEEYIKSREIPIQGEKDPCWFYFPSLYVPSKNILICKNGHKVNVLQFTFSQFGWKCNLEQSIDYGHNWIFGTLSEDGQYLITSDWLSKSIQIRQLTQQEEIQQFVKNNINYYL